MEQINIEHLSQQLFIESVNMDEPLPINRAEEICKPLIDLIGITNDECEKLAQYAVMKGSHCIDAQEMMKTMGIMAEGQRADKTRLKLERYNIVPVGVLNDDIQAGLSGPASNKAAKSKRPQVGAVENKKDTIIAAGPVGPTGQIDNSILYTNRHCQIIQTTEKTNGKTYHPIKYMISRDACFKVLIRAFKQDKYADYFSLKWQIVEQYKKYLNDLQVYKDKQHDQCIIKHQADKIDELISDVKDLKDDNKKLMKMGNKLLRYGKRADKKLDIANAKIDIGNAKIDRLTKFITDFSTTVLTTWNGSSVIKTQLDTFKNSNTKIEKAMESLKLSYTVAFLDGAHLFIYFCCTNFKNVQQRLSELFKRHVGEKMLKPQAISLITIEINSELAVIGSNRFQHVLSMGEKYIERYKAFDITLVDASFADIVYFDIIKTIRANRFQKYQVRMDAMQKDQTIHLSDAVFDHLRNSDMSFFTSSTPLCQEYIDCYIKQTNGKFQYKASDTSTRKRANNMKLTSRNYVLHRISYLVDMDDGRSIFDDMVKDGIITIDDKEELRKLAALEDINVDDYEDELDE